MKDRPVHLGKLCTIMEQNNLQKERGNLLQNIFVGLAPGALFKSLNFIRNFQMGQIS